MTTARGYDILGFAARTAARLGLLAALFAALALAGAQAAGKPAVFSADGAAIAGTDPVAYFKEGRPVKGSPEFSHSWNGATWLFSSAANRDAFAADPQKYAPQYGGYCAYAVSYGSTAPIDPEAWTIVDDKLYLNFSKGIQEKWSQDVQGYIAKADKNWPGVLGK